MYQSNTMNDGITILTICLRSCKKVGQIFFFLFVLYLAILFGSSIIRNFNVYKTANGYNADRTIRMTKLKKGSLSSDIWINLLLKDICKVVNVHHH